jgi:hypothetical protein
MTHSRCALRTLAFTSLLALLGACSPASSGNRNEPQGGSTSSPSGGNGNGTSGNNPGLGGSGVSLGMGGGTSTGSGGDGTAGITCAATSESAKLIPLDLYVMMDSSKSMNEPTSAGATKWKAVTDALKGFFTDANSAGLGIGLKFFPDEQAVPAACAMDSECGSFGPCDQRKACVGKNTFSKVVTTLCTADSDCGTDVCRPVSRCADGANCAKTYCVADGTGACPSDCVPFTGYCRERDVCTAANYATPAVAFATLPDSAPALSAALAARTPDGYTPTGPALTGALQQARDRAKSNPGHKVAVILVTDGLPGGFIPNKPPMSCMPGDIAGVVDVVKNGNMTSADSPAIQTFVIGVFGPCDLVDQNVMPAANLDKLASAGGTTKAVVISTDQNVQQQLQDALKQVRTSAIACQYAVPKSDTGTVDPMKVNVRFNSAATGNTLVYKVPKKDNCDATKGGWYYDNDDKPTQIILCDKSCSDFQAKQDGRVDIALGCATETIR